MAVLEHQAPESTGDVGGPPRLRRKIRGRWTPYLLLAPTLTLIAVFIAYPILTVVRTSLYQYNPNKPWMDGWVGLGNYEKMLGDPLFWDSLQFTAKWVVVEVGLQMIFGLALALVINETFVGRAFARALVFSPWAVSGVLTTTIWLLIYNPTVGFPHILAEQGHVAYGVSPLADGDSAFWAAVLAELWRGVPFFAILILADLQSISGDLYEAAEVDGAGRVRRFTAITFPHIKAALVLATLLRSVWEFNNVDLLYTLTGGGPARATTTLPLYVAQTATVTKEFGYGSALTMAAFVILSLFSITYLWLTRMGQKGKS